MSRPLALAATLFAVLCTATLPSPAAGQDWDAVQIGTQALGGGVYMLTGQGGNIGVFVGDDGVFVIDDQFAPLTDKILAAIRAVTPRPVRWVFNTHWHGDHVGANENFGKAGAVLVAHENVRRRVSVDQVLERVGRRTSASAALPPGAWPAVTFTEEIAFHLNGEHVRAFHVENAHTDGDAIVHFRRANVVHMGDIYFRDTFPFIDTATGGCIDGMVAAADAGLALMDADTKVIPGHGALATREDLRAYRDALKAMRDRVAALMERGDGLDAVQAARPIRDLAERWGQDETAERLFVHTIYWCLGGR